MTYTVTAYSGDKITVGSVNSRNEFTTNVDAGMRGDTGYAGSLGYTGSIGVGYSGSQGSFGYTGSIGSLTPYAHVKQISEPVSTYVGSSGEIQHDCANGTYLFFVYPTGNIIVNLSNLDLNVGETTTVKGTVLQSNSVAYMVQSLKIDGIIPSVYWENGVLPSGNTGMVNDVRFEVYKANIDVYTIKGSSVVYGQV